MPYQRDDIDRKNDTRLATPLLIMGLIIVAGILIYSYTGHAMATGMIP